MTHLSTKSVDNSDTPNPSTQEQKWRAIREHSYNHYSQGFKTVVDNLTIPGLNQILETCKTCAEAIDRVSKEVGADDIQPIINQRITQ